MQVIAFPDVEKQAETLAIAERFFDSVVLFALFETGVFRVLSFGPKTLQEIQDSTADAGRASDRAGSVPERQPGLASVAHAVESHPTGRDS